MRRLLLGILDAISRVYLLGGMRVESGARSRIAWHRVRARRGVLRVGEDSIVLARIDFDTAAGAVIIGSRSYIGASHIVCHTSVNIGDDVIVSWGVTIVDHDSHSLEALQRANDVRQWGSGRKSWEGVGIGPVKIENRVWIGFGATILKGVTIGEGAVIGAQTVVTRDVPRYCLVAGNPAKLVRALGART